MSVIPRNTLLARRSFGDSTVTATFTIAGIVPADATASIFSLSPQLDAPLNLYVPLETLAELVGDIETDEPTVNVLLSKHSDSHRLTELLRHHLRLEHYGLRIRYTYRPQNWCWWTFQDYISIESDRMIIEDEISNKIIHIFKSYGIDAEPTIVYLVNSIKYHNREIPFSIIAGINPDAKPPLGPFRTIDNKKIHDNEIALLDWNESPLNHLSLQDDIKLSIIYYHPEVEGDGKLEIKNLRFCGYIPMSGCGGDRYLTPLVKGITDQGTHPRDWDRPPQLTNAKVREKIRAGDVHDRFWQRYGPTPKAFVTLSTARELFASRYGSTTSIRVANTNAEEVERLLLDHLDPHMMGMGFESLRQRISTAGKGAEIFSILFLSFSIFLITSSFLLIILINRLSVERRSSEIGLLLSLGFNKLDSMYLLLTESLFVSLLGAIIGIFLGILYCFFILKILSSFWPIDDLRQVVKLHITINKFIFCSLITIVLGLLSQWWTLRGLMNISISQLLHGEHERSGTTTVYRWRPVLFLAIFCLVGVAMFTGWSGRASTPEERTIGFFGAGFLLLVSSVTALYSIWLRGGWGDVQGPGWKSLIRLGWRNLERWPRRSLLTIGLLSAAVFLLIAVESFRRQPDKNIWDKASGSGGFNLICECDIPLYDPLDHGPGRVDMETQLQSAFGGSGEDERYQRAIDLLDRIEIEMLRLRDGDDASCGNLYQTQRPRVLGVSQQFIMRGGFRFSRTLAETEAEQNNPWLLLHKAWGNGEVPIFCEQDTAQWKFFTDVGGTINLEGDNGKQIVCRLVGTFVNSPFPGELVMADEYFRHVFPRSEGYRFLLIRTPPEDEQFARQVLEMGLRHHGARVVRTSERLGQALGIISAYLTTFQILGALGLLLGVGGLGIVILRNIWERIGELALLRAMGYRWCHLRGLILLEHSLLFVGGVMFGVVSAGVAVIPHVWEGGEIPWTNLIMLLSGVVTCGFAVAYWGSSGILRLPLLTALRNK
jgi:ABC-type lipoprotein release transport system permease subunit